MEERKFFERDGWAKLYFIWHHRAHLFLNLYDFDLITIFSKTILKYLKHRQMFQNGAEFKVIRNFMMIFFIIINQILSLMQIGLFLPKLKFYKVRFYNFSFTSGLPSTNYVISGCYGTKLLVVIGLNPLFFPLCLCSFFKKGISMK